MFPPPWLLLLALGVALHPCQGAVAPLPWHGLLDLPVLPQLHSSRPRPPASEDIPLEDLAAPSTAGSPEQIHVSLGGPGQVVVSWVTGKVKQAAADFEVRFGGSPGAYTATAAATSASYTRHSYTSGNIHHAVLDGLDEGGRYYYVCTGPGGTVSSEYSFLASPGPALQPGGFEFALVGDLGQTKNSATTLGHIGASGAPMVLHVGDLSYADNFQPRWDTWGRLIEPVAARLPWMVTNGNHERESDGSLPEFQSYTARWRPTLPAAPPSPSPMYYSFDVAGVHFAFLSSYTPYGPGSPQFEWALRDLGGVDRAATPWLVVAMHAPWSYNSNYAHRGEMVAMQAALEPTFAAADVDVVFAGHVHAYERTYPVLNSKVTACAPTYINIGDGGNREGLAAAYVTPQPSWSAFREASYGHGVLSVQNATHARWAWHRNQDGEPAESDGVQFVRSAGCDGGREEGAAEAA